MISKQINLILCWFKIQDRSGFFSMGIDGIVVACYWSISCGWQVREEKESILIKD